MHTFRLDSLLVVKVININKGHNEEKLRRSEKLEGHSIFIAKVREYEAERGDREEAVKGAVKYCIERNILADFLRKNGSEVSNMLYTEWNWDDALAVRYEEGREQGREEIAKNALDKGIPIDTVSEITGLDIETINRIR
jgi:hypothetical protein